MGIGGGGGRSSPGSLTPMGSPVPWRKANVRHTSNELYVDIVETLSVLIAPSGRPLSAMTNGTIAFTAKVSGVPELFMQLSAPGGIGNTVSLPAFHPCIRLKRWNDRPGELSFVPPDGRFVLAGYEVDLLGDAALDAFTTEKKASAVPKLNIPATTSILTSLGPTGADFEVRLHLNPRYAGKSSSSAHSALSSASRGHGANPLAAGLGRGLAGGLAGNLGGNAQGTTAAPTIEEIVVHVPLPAGVKNIAELRTSRGAGEAGYAPGDRAIEWRLNAREVGVLMGQDRGSGTGVLATLYGSVVASEDGNDEAEAADGASAPFSRGNAYEYTFDDEERTSSYQSLQEGQDETREREKRQEERDARRAKNNKVFMPSCATVSFSVKGWLPSGIKVDSLSVDAKRSTGLGAGVQPYKGVKYVGVSRRGVECRA